MTQQKYQTLVTKENIDYCLSKLKDEDEKKDFMDVISKVDIKIDTKPGIAKPVIGGREICYNIFIRDRNTKQRKYFQICTLWFLKGEKIETIPPNLIDILNEIRRWLDQPDAFRNCYEVLPKESTNEYSMRPIDWKRFFSWVIKKQLYQKLSLV